MKKSGFALLLVFISLSLAACNINDNLCDAPETQDSLFTPSEPNIPSANDSEIKQGNNGEAIEAPSLSSTETECYPYAYEMCTVNIYEIRSWQHWTEADFNHIEHNAMVADFVRDFQNVHTATFTLFPPIYWHDTIVLWTDTPLHNFSIVSLNAMFYERGLVISTLETLFAIDEMLPTDVVALNVDSLHYIYPRLAIIFTDESGLENRMFIMLSMEGGYSPRYFLQPVNAYHITEWHPTQSNTEYEQDTTTDVVIEEVWPRMGFPDNWHAWTLFALNDLRYDVVEFFHSVYDLNTSQIDYWAWMNPSSEGIVHTVGSWIARTKIADPALYAEIIESIERESNKLNLDENISSLVDLLFIYIQQHYERDMEFLTSHLQDREEVIPRAWRDDVDWEISPDSVHRRDWEIQGIRLLFEHGLTEQGVQHVMYLMLFSNDIFISNCAIIIAAAIGDEARDMLIEGLVERIIALRDGGFDIYKEYIEMLTDPRRVFDPRTKEIHERISQLIEELV